MLRIRTLAAAVAALSLLAVSASPAAAADVRPVPECVEKLFYVYITEPQDPWSPDDCLSSSRSARPLPDTGPLMCVVWSAVRDPTYISCI